MMVNEELLGLRDEICQWIMDHNQDLGYDPKRTDPHTVATRYIEVVQQAIARGFASRTEMDKKFKLYRIQLDWCKRTLGRYGPNRQYWWHTLLAKFPLFEIIERSNGINLDHKRGKPLSQVRMMYMIDWDAQTIWTERDQAQANPELFDWVEIDTGSLGHYILQADNPKYRDKAEQIFEKYEANQGRFPMLRRPADSGRMYYGGINLQNCPSVVRRAALGQHHEYDLTTSVYSWQMVVMRLITGVGKYDAPPGTSYTRELIRHKQRVRNELAQLLTNTAESARLPVIKQAITAIGFGARTSNAYYEGDQLVTQGLAGVIHNPGDRKAFLQDPWVKSFLKEQNTIGKTIVGTMLAEFPEHKQDPLYMHNNRFSPKRYLAFLYQHFESRVLRTVISQPEVQAAEPLLWIHDCIYTRKAIPLDNINSLLMMDFGDGICLEHKENNAWRGLAPSPEQEQQERAERHRRELAHWASRGYDISGIAQAPQSKFKPQTSQTGHYNYSPSAYESGENPHLGKWAEEEFIRRIYKS